MFHSDWSSLSNALSERLLKIPYSPLREAPETCHWTFRKDEPGADYRRAEEPYRAAVELCLSRFCSTGEYQPPSMEVEYFAGVRSGTVNTFLQHLGIENNPGSDHTIFLHPPDVTPEESLRWLLIDWWNVFGPMLAEYDEIWIAYWEPTVA